MDVSQHPNHVMTTAGVLASLRIVCDKLEDVQRVAESASDTYGSGIAIRQHTADLHAEAEAIDTHLLHLDSSVESSVLRPVAVKAYNTARNAMTRLQNRGDQSLAVALCRVRHSCALVMLRCCSNKAANASIETARCLYRTAVSWLAIPGQEIEAYRAYCAVLACHQSSGGVQANARILGGQDLEAHLQIVYDCLIQKAAFEWSAITVGKFSPALLLMASHSQGYGTTAPLAVGEGVVATPAAVAQLHDKVLKELAEEAASLLSYLPHQSPVLSSLCAERGKWYTDQAEYSRAKAWLERALSLAQTGKQGVPESAAASVVPMSMLLLAACELGIAEAQKKAYSGSAAPLGQAAGAGALGVFDLHSLAQKVQGYITGAGAANTLLGAHLQLKLCCVQEDMDGATAQFSQLLGHLASSMLSGSSWPPGSSNTEATAARRTVPLGNNGDAAAVQVHPDYPLIASACRALADLRRYDDQALRAYGEAGQHFKGMGSQGHLENTLLMHDLLSGLVISIGNSPSSTSSNGDGEGGVCTHLLLEDRRVGFVLGAMLKRHAQRQAPMPAHVRTAVVTILEGGLRSAFEARAWSSAEKLGNLLLQVFAGDQAHNEPEFGATREGVMDAERQTAQSDVHRVLSLAYIHKGDLALALDHAVKACKLADNPSIRFQVFRILAHMTCPSSSSTDGPAGLPTAQHIADMLREQLQGCSPQSVDVSSLDTSRADGYVQALCSAFVAFVRGCSTLTGGNASPQAMAGVLLLAVDVIVRGCSPDGLHELSKLNDSYTGSAQEGSSSAAASVWNLAEGNTASLQAHAPKLAVACTALELLLRLCEGQQWDSTTLSPTLRVATLVEQLFSLRRVLRQMEGEGKAASRSAVHARGDLKLLSVCLSRINTCRKEDSDHVAFVHAVARTCAMPEQMAWCMRTAYSCAMTSHQHGDTVGSLAGLMLVSSLGMILHQMLAQGDTEQAGNGPRGLLTWGMDEVDSVSGEPAWVRAAAVPPFLLPELRTKNLLIILRSSALLQALAHLQLSADVRDKAGMTDTVGAAVGKEAVGVDLCTPLLGHSEMTFLQSALQSILACRRTAQDLSQQEQRLKATATQAGVAPAVLDVLLQTVQQEDSPQVLTDAEILCTLTDLSSAAETSCALTIHGYRGGPGSTKARDDGGTDCPSPAALQALARDEKALAAVLAVLEFHATAKQQALQGTGAAPGGNGQAVDTGLSKAAVEQLSAQIGRLQLLPGMNAHLLENIACIVQSEPCKQPPLALRALHAAMGLALKPLSAADSLAGQRAVDYPYVAFLLQRMMQVLDSRKDSLPVLDTAMIAVQACARAALADSPRTLTGMEEEGQAVRLFPVEALDALACKAWNHGIFYSRVNALNMAESFMSWTMRALPLLLQLEALTGKDRRRAHALSQAFRAVSGAEGAEDVLSELKRRECVYWLPQARLAVQLLQSMDQTPAQASAGHAAIQTSARLFSELCGLSKVLTDTTVGLEACRLLPCCEDVLRQQGVHPESVPVQGGVMVQAGRVQQQTAVPAVPTVPTTATLAVAPPVPIALLVPSAAAAPEAVPVPERVAGRKALRTASTDNLLLMQEEETCATDDRSATETSLSLKKSHTSSDSEGRDADVSVAPCQAGVPQPRMVCDPPTVAAHAEGMQPTGHEGGHGRTSEAMQGEEAVSVAHQPLMDVMEEHSVPSVHSQPQAQAQAQVEHGSDSRAQADGPKQSVPLMQPEEEWESVEMAEADSNELL